MKEKSYLSGKTNSKAQKNTSKNKHENIDGKSIKNGTSHENQATNQHGYPAPKSSGGV